MPPKSREGLPLGRKRRDVTWQEQGGVSAGTGSILSPGEHDMVVHTPIIC